MLIYVSQLLPLLFNWDGVSCKAFKTSNQRLQALVFDGLDDVLNPSSVKQLFKYNRPAFDSAVKAGVFFEYQTHVFTLKRERGRYTVESFNLDTTETRLFTLSYTTLKALTAECAHRDVIDVLNGLLKAFA